MNDKYIVDPDGCLTVTGVVTENDLLGDYDEFLDCDGPLVMVGLDYWPSDVLPDIDPTAYRCGFHDWIDDMLEAGELVEYEDGHEWLSEGGDGE